MSPITKTFPAEATSLIRPCSRRNANLTILCVLCRADVVLVGNEVNIVEEVKKTTGKRSAISPAERMYMLSTYMNAFSSHAWYIAFLLEMSPDLEEVLKALILLADGKMAWGALSPIGGMALIIATP